jgi:hypothetical protein
MSRYAVDIFVSRQAECMIIPLWRKGNDTSSIAKTLSIPEFEVANRLPELLRRQQQGK